MVDFDLREFAYLDPEGARAHRAGVPQRSALRLFARERLYLTTRRLRVEATSETMTDVADEGRQRVRSVVDYDWEGGFVWSANADQSPTRQLVAELDYDGENLYRRNHLDFVTRYVESPAVRLMPDVDLFLGDGRVEELGLRLFAGQQARVRKVAALPGVFWEVWVLPLEGVPFESMEQVSAYLVGSMGVPPSRARRLVEHLGGVPVKITVNLFSGADAWVLIEGFLRDVSWQRDVLAIEPIRGVGEDEELEMQLKDAGFLLGAVRHLDQLSTGLTPTMVFLKLSEHMTPAHLDTVLEILFDLDNAYAQIELVRALLRCRQIASWRHLREILHGDRGERAMNVVEALIAEADAKALSALMHVLHARDEFVDVDSDAVVMWGLSHVRILSGMRLAELVKYSTPGAIPDVTLERSSAARSAELDRWLRWWEKKQSSVPRL